MLPSPSPSVPLQVSEHSFNLSELLRRLGATSRGDTSVDLSRTVRLTASAGDLSHLTPPIPVPIVGFNGSVVGVGGEFSYLQIHSRAPGGTLILSAVEQFANLNYPFGVFLTDQLPAGVAIPRQDLVPSQPGVTSMKVDTLVADLIPLPNVFARSSAWVAFENLWIEGGAYLLVKTAGLAASIESSWVLQEFPASPRPA